VEVDEMGEKLRESGIEVLGSVPWGTHICQWYETKQDLLDILVPYFRAGLENNELCVWITSAPIDDSDAQKALRESMALFDSYAKRGQIEIIPYTEWYVSDGSFSPQRALGLASNKIAEMADKGCEGLRVAGNAGWLEKRDWESFTRYEEMVDHFMSEHPVVAICSYPLDGYGVREFLDVVKNHCLALTKQRGVWQIMEPPGRKRTEAALRKTEEKYRHLFENTQTAMEVIDAQTGLVALANEATARIFGFASPDDLIGVDSMEYLRPEDRDRVANQMAQVLADKNWREIAELRVRRANGQWLWITGVGVQTEFQGKPALLVSLIDVTSRKEAEQKLMESEEKNRLLIDNAGEGIAVIQDGVLKFVNRRFTELSMYSAEELISRPFVDLIHPDDREMVAEYHAKRMRGDAVPQHYQFKWIDKEGVPKWVEVDVALLTWEGKPAALAMLNDVTERRYAGETLWASEEKYRVMTEKMNDIIWTLDLNLHTTYVSPSVEKVLGFTPEERLAQNPQMQMTPESFAQVQVLLCAQLDREREQGHGLDPERTVKVEVEYYHKNGSTVWLENLVSGIRDANGTLISIHGVSRDITERKKAEQALSESERRYRLLAENISDVIWVTDMSLRPIYFSPSITRLLGYSVEEAMAGTIETRLTSASLDAVTDTFARVLALEQREPGKLSGQGTLELEFKRKDGSIVWADTTVSFLRDPSGRPVEILGVLRDISERKKAEEGLHHSLEVLERTIEGTVQAIASTVETKDRYTAGHQRRVSQLACATAREMGLSSDRTRAIRTAGLLHDLGKMSLPAEILSKPGKLTDTEFALIKTHPQAAYDILKNIESFWEIADIVLQHHERMNGSGYPFGLRGEGILLGARILAVSDVVEAMFSHRPYRPSLGLDKALEEIMHNSGTLYDPDVVSASLRVFTEKGFEFED
jgi:PAS domain S-box-containing protein